LFNFLIVEIFSLLIESCNFVQFSHLD